MNIIISLTVAGEQKSLTARDFLLALLIHGYYDFVLFSINDLGIISPLTIIPLLIVCFIKLRFMMKTAIKADRAAGRVKELLC